MANALAHEKSPYLLQHANNPVAWLPWGEAAFAKARAEQKPIFLSIGYSTCHWCHVMAAEAFESPDCAEVLNRGFVPIKVDREERPDVDRVYMSFVQAVTGHGGWPLSAWLTPELKPFYGGTYFPLSDRDGRPGFVSILRAIEHAWGNEREKLLAEADRVVGALREHFLTTAASPQGGSEVSSLADSAGAAFEAGFQHFYEAFDPNHGGFGSAPKFPRAANLNFLFRVAALQGAGSEIGAESIKMATTTLQAMARGGVHDHVGGGFHRYSVDERWFVPHFEKMLYDQAQIAINCIEARQATGDERYAWVARDIFGYVLDRLTSADGAFFTAEDADSSLADEPSRHAEGAYYVWTHQQLHLALGDSTPFFCAHFGATQSGNVPAELDPQREFSGRNILAQTQALGETAKSFSLAPQEASDRLVACLEKLRAARLQRPRPHLDDKVLAANNGLMISALARAHGVIDSELAYRDAARRAAAFVRTHMYDSSSGLLGRSWRGARSNVSGFAEDYAYLIQGLLDLYEADFAIEWLQWAEALQRKMDELFWDDAGGGYFNSAAGDTSIVLRLKEDYDGAEPAPSSVAASNLIRLGVMLNDDGFRQRGRQTIAAFQRQWSRAPQAMPQMLCALELALEPPRHIVIAGEPSTTEFSAFVAAARQPFGPRRVLLAADGQEGQAWLARRAPWMKEMRSNSGRPVGYVCEDFACQAPVDTPAELARLLLPR